MSRLVLSSYATSFDMVTFASSVFVTSFACVGAHAYFAEVVGIILCV